MNRSQRQVDVRRQVAQLTRTSTQLLRIHPAPPGGSPPPLLASSRMILIDDKASAPARPSTAADASRLGATPPRPSPSSSSSERAPLLPVVAQESRLPPPSYASVVTPLSQPSRDESTLSEKPRRLQWGRWLFFALVLYLSAGLLAEGITRRPDQTEEPEKSPDEDTPSPPSPPRQPDCPGLP